MTYDCKLSDKTINLRTKYKPSKRKKHKYLEDFIIMRYIVEYPDNIQLNDMMQKYIDIHNKKYDLYQVRCVLKVNDNQYPTCKPMLNLAYITYRNINFKNQPYFSRVVETRITFFSSHWHMTYDYYLKQP